MAITFSASGPKYGYNTSAAPVTATPLSMAAWVNLASTAVVQSILYVGDKDATAGQHLFQLGINTSTQLLARTADGSSANASTYTTTALSAGVWTHCGGAWASATSRIAYYNGLAATENTTSRTPAGCDSVGTGCRISATSTFDVFLRGDMAEAAIWNVALTAAEFAMLAAGYSPLFVRPQSLINYWPFVRTPDGTNEYDRLGVSPITLAGTPAVANHPKIIMPRRRGMRTLRFTAKPPVTMHHRKLIAA